ncbi:hypothetical protein HNQ92_003674 [Rhabdobacter roseus]|uniref:Uncharacterized protein n=1 Tax=Rhabdobacter roseus TaxID=1655419 RepID=A0A840TV43_9BACT|nr:hypothetical protein [Rhabdobacter roseus]MBB5285517.1 hypothetical protein [Rhabdobacter roseus]
MTLFKTLFYLLAALGLLLTIVPAVLVFTGTISNAEHKNLMAVGMVLWFVGITRIMKR